MKFKKHIVIVLLLFNALPVFRVNAQNYSQDIEKIRAEYRSACRTFTMKYIYYPYDSLNKATDSMYGRCMVNGNLYYYSISSGRNTYEYIKSGKYYIVIDHPKKLIAVKYSSGSKQDVWSIDKIDSLLRKASVKTTYKLIDKKTAQYEITYAQGEGPWDKVRIVFDKANYTLSQVWLYSGAKGKLLGEPYNKPKIGIFYSAFKENTPDKNIFSEETYIVNTGKEIMPAARYKNYKLLNYVNQKS